MTKILTLVVVALLVCVSLTTSELQILSVSNLAYEVSTPAQSSLRGGKEIYIRAVGHSVLAQDISIELVNSAGTKFADCTVPSDGVLDTSITCEAGDSSLSWDSGDLYVKLTSGTSTVTSSGSNKVQFKWNKTPFLYDVFPTSGTGGQQVSFWGFHRISDVGDGLRNMGDIRHLKIGDEICDTFDVTQSGDYNSNLNSHLLCKQSIFQEAGMYTLDENLHLYGTADNAHTLNRTSFTPTANHQFTVLPKITEINSTEGSTYGNILSIKGTGFSSTSSNNVVKVANTPCTILSSSLNEIVCELATQVASPSTMLGTNTSGVQLNGYHQGAGFKYMRHTYSGSISDYVTAVRGSTLTASDVQQDGYRTDIRESDLYDTNYCQVWKGYFHASVAGDYTFRAWGDDKVRVYLASDYGDATPLTDSELIISTSDYQNSYSYYIRDLMSEGQVVRTLEADKSYYMQVYHCNIWGGGFINFEVEVPTATGNSFTPQVDKITIASEITPEIDVYVMSKGNSVDSFTLRLYRVENNQVYDVTKTLNYDCTDAQFLSAINSFDIYHSNYITTVTKEYYNSAGSVVATEADCNTIRYSVSIEKMRSSSHLTQSLTITNSGDSSLSKMNGLGQDHSPLVSGSWMLNYVNTDASGNDISQSFTFDYDVAASTVQASIRTLANFENVEVYKESTGYGCGYSCYWVIQYERINNAIADATFTLSGSVLQGGTSTGTTNITRTNRRAYSTNQLFHPIDYTFMRTDGMYHPVELTVNSIMAVCGTNCGYQFKDMGKVTALSRTASTATLTISDPQSVGYALTDIFVTIAGQPCPVNTAAGSIASFTCSLAENPDTSPILIADSNTPKVFVRGGGLLQLDTGVNPLAATLTANTPTATLNGNNGGYPVSITGTGFPLSTSDVTVTACGSAATVSYVSNTEIIFEMPSCINIGAQNVEISTTSAAAPVTTSFTLADAMTTAPSISSLTPASANPGIKQKITIAGSNFGSVATDLAVTLRNSSGTAYTLKVMSVSAAGDEIVAGLPGGVAGSFTLVVWRSGLGNSVAASAGSDTFTYEVIINNISPITGNYYGGTLITIDGVNFATGSQETLVFVGDQLNQMCKIETITTTQITCRTPAIHQFDVDDGKVNTPLDVKVATRLVQLSTCGGTCTFAYNTLASSPILSAISPTTLVSGSTLAITGEGLNNGACDVVLTNQADSTDIHVVTAAVCLTNAVTAPLTSIPSANYWVQVKTTNGYTNQYSVAVEWDTGTISKGSSMAGAYYNIVGANGWPTTLTSSYSIRISTPTRIIPTNVVSCCTGGDVTIQLPSVTENTTFTLTFTSPVNTVTKTAVLSGTQSATLTTAMPVSAGTQSLAITASNTVTAVKVVSKADPSVMATVTNLVTSGSPITFDADLTVGAWMVVASGPTNFLACTEEIQVSKPTLTAASSPVDASFKGGRFTINGANLGSGSYITVNGNKGAYISSDASSATYAIPPLVTSNSQAFFSDMLATPISLIDSGAYTKISDNSAAQSFAFDDAHDTVYTSSSATCYIGLDFGSGHAASISRIRIFPNSAWTEVIKKLLYATFEGSNDMATWTTIAQVTQTVQGGWNTLSANMSSTLYRYVRFSHTNTSMCNLAQLEFWGIVYDDLTANTAGHVSDVMYFDGFTDNSQTFAGAVSYKETATPCVEGVSPIYGDIYGGYELTLNGSNLDHTTASIWVDGIECSSPASVNATAIKCTVGARMSLPTENTFTVTINGNSALLKEEFLYVLRWSDDRTWGTDVPPVAGDLVAVPQGMTLLVDQSVPSALEGIAVQNGTIIFSDDMDLQIHTGFITLVGGKFIAGTEARPHMHALTFVMYGNYYGAQQPTFGNKGIGCLDCKFSMYGQERSVTWTELSATANAGSTTISVENAGDWQVNEYIVIASTSFNHYEAEMRQITAISGNDLTLNEALQFKHVSQIETHGSHHLAMKAEVGLLTRNIKVKGDSTSEVDRYGAHLLIAGKGANGAYGHVAYSEFTHCGQPKILGRYCIHFHMMGDVPDSYSRGNAVHDSFARLTTVHGVHYLTVENNVGYKISGHNIFVEDGIETNNVIRNNLIVSSRAVNNMLQTDTSVASIWVTHPSNHVYGNHVAGSDFYGIWYEIKEHPDGPSASTGVCPIGNPIGTVQNNVAHSNTRFGLRIDKMFARTYPCDEVRDDSNTVDPWAANPSLQQVYRNFTIYKCMEDGVLAEDTGNLFFDNFVIAESWRSGIEFYTSNHTREIPGLNNSAIIGVSNTNPHSDNVNYSTMAAMWTGRSGRYSFKNVSVHNYNVAGSTVLKTCSHCDDPLKYTNRGTDVFIEQISMTNVNANYLHWSGSGIKRDVVYDLDGSFSSVFDGQSRSNGTITHYWPHMHYDNPTDCPNATDMTKWDDAIMCAGSLHVRRVKFANMIPHQDFKVMRMKAAQVSSLDEFLPVDATLTSDRYSDVYHLMDGTNMVSKDEKYSWTLPFIAGKIYSIWWGSGVDWTHMAVESHEYPQWEDGIIFKFNNTQQRQYYDVSYRQGATVLDHQSDSLGLTLDVKTDAPPLTIDPATCQDGQMSSNFSMNNTFWQTMGMCLSGKNTAAKRTPFQYTEVDATMCDLFCPSYDENFVADGYTRYWSTAADWNEKPDCIGDCVPFQYNTMVDVGSAASVPAEGADVYLHGNHTWILDQNITVGNLTIDGRLLVEKNSKIILGAKAIHVRYTTGKLATRERMESGAYFIIEMLGTKFSGSYTISPLVGSSKIMAISGQLELLGAKPATTQTYLTAYAAAGSNSITVASSTGWVVGDELALSPSFADRTQYETVTIQDISGNTITLTSALMYSHYGAADSEVLSTTSGTLDTRARVGHLTRNVKIRAGEDADWGFTVYITQYFQNLAPLTDLTVGVWRNGSATIDGVQFIDGGQLDSTNSPLKFKDLSNLSSSVVDSSFMGCKAFCVQVDNSEQVSLTNNIFYNAWVYGVEVEESTDLKSFTFTNNLIIGVGPRPTVASDQELIACFATYKYFAPDAGNLIENNECYGSVHGFALPHTLCTQLQTHAMKNNVAGSCDIGFAFNKNSQGNKCLGFSYIKAFSCNIGQICGPPSIEALQYSNFVMAENGRSVTLKIGASEGGHNHVAHFTNSSVHAIARPTCTDCYTQSTHCSNSVGVRLFSASANGQTMPSKFGSSLDVICKQEVFSTEAYLSNVTFNGFKQTYTNANYASCSGNFVFRPHNGASDQTAGHFLQSCPCTDCDTESYVKCDHPNPGGIGWFGGCGDIHCSGKKNYMVHDMTGDFLGFTGVVIPNSELANNEAACTYKASMNGSVCTSMSGTVDYGTLEYQNVDDDQQSRIMWPVDLKYDGSEYWTKTNGWREWEWFGRQPRNQRFGRFISNVRLNQVYNMTFAASPPGVMQVQLQSRTEAGNSSNHVVVRLHYPFPNMIEVKKIFVDANSQTTRTRQVQRPILMTDNGFSRAINTSVCGDNLYNYENYTIVFVVTEDPNCFLEISLRETIQLTTHFAITEAEFFASDAPETNFINNLAALLSIQDTSRIKVVGVFSGSIKIVATVSPADNTSTTAGSSQPTQTEVQQVVGSVIGTDAFSNAVSPGVGTVISSTSTHYSAPTYTEESSSDDTNIALIVGISVAGVAITVVLVLVLIYVVRRRSQVGNLQTQDSQVNQEFDDKDKNPSFLSDNKEHVAEQSEFKIKNGSEEFKVEVENVEDFA